MIRKSMLTIMEWLWRLVYLNLVWILFCLPIITIIPSTFALFSVANKWINEDNDIAIFTTFRQRFFSLFRKSYLYGLILTLIGGFLIADLMIVSSLDGPFFLTIRYTLLLLIILYVITITYSVPVYLNYGFRLHKTLFLALMFGLKQPIITSMVLIGIAFSIVLFIFSTGFGILILGSVPALIACKATHNMMNRLATT